mgnify:CR=1 FL=1
MNDGILDVMIIEAEQTVQLLQTIMSSLFDPNARGGNRPLLACHSGRRIHVTSTEPLPLEIDGDPLDDMVTEWEAEILPGASTIIVDEISPYYTN